MAFKPLNYQANDISCAFGVPSVIRVSKFLDYPAMDYKQRCKSHYNSHSSNFDHLRPSILPLTAIPIAFF